MSIAVGKRPQIESASPASAGGAPTASEPVPGKRTLLSEIQMPQTTVTGDALADASSADGLDATGPNTFLDPGQRSRLVTDGMVRWVAVEVRMHQALAAVSLREAIRPDDPPSFLISLLVTAASVATMMGAGFVADMAREHGAELLERSPVFQSLGAHPTLRQKALMALSTVSPKAIDAALEIGVETGKESVSDGVTAASEDVADTRRDSVLEVLDGFHDQISARLQSVREIVPAQAVAAGDDAQLLSWRQLADASGPLTFEHYRLLFQEKIVRFLGAGLQHVGTDRTPLGTDTYTERLQWRLLHGKRRLAVLETVTALGCEPDLGEATFQRWVPEEFEESAVELSEARGVEVTSLGDPEEHPTCEPDLAAAEGLVPL